MVRRQFYWVLKVPRPLVTLWVGMQKEGFSDCEERSIGRKIVLLTVIGNAKMDRIVIEKRMVFAKWFRKLRPWSKQDTGISREVWLTCADVIHLNVCIKVDEDVFFVTVDEEPVEVADWTGGFELGLGGNANIASSPSISISIVPDSFGQDITGNHIPGLISPPQVVVHNSKCKLERQVMIANIERGVEIMMRVGRFTWKCKSAPSSDGSDR
ncbi:hypothetical protein Ancab_018868 [Ancistrocladus abbreviatus]